MTSLILGYGLDVYKIFTFTVELSKFSSSDLALGKN